MKKDNIPDIENTAAAVAKGVVGTIPLVSTMAGELLGLIAAASLEKRREKWMEEVGVHLRELEENVSLTFQHYHPMISLLMPSHRQFRSY